MGVLNTKQLNEIKNHKYSCDNISYLDPYLQPFWNWLVQYIPLYVAPNTLTIVGLIVNIITTLTLVIINPTANESAPRWAHFLAFIGIFVYQTLDAMDGKHARRTDTCSPLGEIFDHGCDAISTIFITLSILTTMRIGEYQVFFLIMIFVIQFIFYIVHWRGYLTGRILFSKFSVTESQFLCMFGFIMATIFGDGIFIMEIVTVKFNCYLCLFVSLLLVVVIKDDMYYILCVGGIGKNGSSIANTGVLSPLRPIIVMMALLLMVLWKSNMSIYLDQPVTFLLSFGCVFIKICTNLIISNMGKSKILYLDSSFIGPGFIVANQYFNNIIEPSTLIIMSLVYVWMDLCWGNYRLISQISLHLDIPIFTVSQKKQHAAMFKSTNNYEWKKQPIEGIEGKLDKFDKTADERNTRRYDTYSFNN